MTEITHWLTLDEVADALRISPRRVRQLISDRQLVGERRDGDLAVPADFLQEGHVVKGLSGTITLLHDAGYDEEETLRWLYTSDDTLPGTPIEALRANRGREIKRRAQAAGY